MWPRKWSIGSLRKTSNHFVCMLLAPGPCKYTKKLSRKSNDESYNISPKTHICRSRKHQNRSKSGPGSSLGRVWGPAGPQDGPRRPKNRKKDIMDLPPQGVQNFIKIDKHLKTNNLTKFGRPHINRNSNHFHQTSNDNIKSATWHPWRSLMFALPGEPGHLPYLHWCSQ